MPCGYFDDIRVEEEEGKTGKIVIFWVKEKQTIRSVKYEGTEVDYAIPKSWRNCERRKSDLARNRLTIPARSRRPKRSSR